MNSSIETDIQCNGKKEQNNTQRQWSGTIWYWYAFT